MLDRPPTGRANDRGNKNEVTTVVSRRTRQAERTRRYRPRQKDGIAVATITYTTAVVDMLVRLRWLSEADASDRRKIAAAISAMNEDAARR
jgi:hypothetical protein